MQHAIPAQPCQQAAQKHQQHLGADPFQSVNPAKETDRRYIGTGIAQGQCVHRQAMRPGIDFARGLHAQVRRAVVNDLFQFKQFRQFVFHGGAASSGLRGTFQSGAAVCAAHHFSRVSACFSFYSCKTLRILFVWTTSNFLAWKLLDTIVKSSREGRLCHA